MNCPEIAHAHEIDARDGRGGRWRVVAIVENGAYRSWTPYPSKHLVVEYCQTSKEIMLRRGGSIPEGPQS